MTDLNRLSQERENTHFWPQQRTLNMTALGCPCDTESHNSVRRSHRRLLYVFAATVALATITYLAVVNAADPPRTFVVWDETEDVPWLSPRTGQPATATNAVACNMALREIAAAAPTGSLLSCRNARKRK